MKMTSKISKTRQFLKSKLKISFFILKRILFFFLPLIISPVRVFKKEFIEHNHQKHNVQYSKVLDSVTYKNNVDKVRTNIHEFENKYSSKHNESGYYKLINASVVSENAIAITSSGFILAHTFLMINSHNIENFDNTLLRYFLRTRVTFRIESAIVISTEGTSGYYHWMIDALPKIMMVNDIFFNENPLIIIPKNDKSFIEESLSLYGIKNYILSYKNFNCKVNKLYVPELISDVGNPRLETLNFLKNVIIKESGYFETRSKRIYVSRRNSSKRRVLNENELMATLSLYGFELFELEKLSLEKTIKLFMSAEIVVAPHGAGLTNIVYCNSETTVIELFPNNYFEECYQNISNLLQLNHIAIQENNGDLNENFTLDIDRFIVLSSNIIF